MARDRAKINTGIWGSGDWKSLTRDQQWLYTTLLTRPELNHVGVGDWRVRRLSNLVTETTTQDVEDAALVLQQRRFILVDEESEEVLIRSFLKHDGVLDNPNLGASIKGAYDSVTSTMLQQVVIYELRKLTDGNPDIPVLKSAKSRKHIEALLQLPGTPIDDYLHVVPNAVPEGHPSTPSTTALGTTCTTAFKKGGPSTTATTTSLSKERESEREEPAADAAIGESFESWWKLYPRKIGKGQARKAFKAALKKTDLDTLTTGVETYSASVDDTEQQFIAHPATWLNGERWDDDTGPPPSKPAFDPWTIPPEAYLHPEEREDRASTSTQSTNAGGGPHPF